MEAIAGNSAEAISLLQLAIDKMEAVRHGLQVESFRIAFLTDHLQLYREMVVYLIEQGENEQAFQMVERSKSRLISEKLTVRVRQDVQQAAASDDKRVQMLGEQLHMALEQLDEEYQLARISQMRDHEHQSPGRDGSASILVLEHLYSALA